MITFHFHCGCQYPEEEVSTDARTKRIICPIHKLTAQKKTGTCEDCGVPIKVHLTGSPTRRCKACRKIHDRLQVKIYQKKAKEDIPVTVKEPKRKTDCIYLVGSCLRPPNGKLLLNNSACIGCKKYSPMALDIQDYMYRGGDSITLRADT